MSTIKVDTIRNYDSAVDFSQGFNIGGASIIQSYTESATVPETPTPVNGDYWWDTANNVLYRYMDGGFRALGLAAAVPYGSRAVIYNSASGSGSNHSNTIDYFAIDTLGNSSSFGTMLGTTTNGGSAHNVTVSNGSRIVYGAYYDNTDSSNPPVNGLEYVTASTLGNSTFMGTFTHRSGITGAGWGGKGYYAGGTGSNNDIEVVDIDNGGNATDSGYDIASHDNGGTHASDSRWITAGGQAPNQYATTITYFAIPVVATSSTFGNLSQGRTNPTGTGSDVRMLIAGGFYYSGSEALDNRVRNDIDYITMATTGNSTDFGDLTVKRTSTGSTSNNVRAVFIGGFAGTSGRTNTIDYVTIDTTGNASDFGDMSGAGSYASTASGT